MDSTLKALRTAMFLCASAALLLFYVGSAQAQGPSFDCKKAKTRVEKAICSDKDLSKMDQELSEVYKDLWNRLGVKERKALKDSQAEWLKVRDGASQVKSNMNMLQVLNDVYSIRIVELIGDRDYPGTGMGEAEKESGGETILKLVSKEDISYFDSMEKKHPPYPDVWGYEFPCPRKAFCDAHISAMMVPSGDVIVTYVETITKNKPMNPLDLSIDLKTAGVLFFSQKRVSFTDEAIIAFGRDRKHISEKRVVFKDGTVIEHQSSNSPNCWDAYEVPNLVVKDGGGNVIAQKMLLSLRDRPVRRAINQICERNWDYNRNYMLETASAVVLRIAPLEDDTFLLFDAVGNMIIRFDKNLNTKSDLLNRKVFLVDFVPLKKTISDRLIHLGQSHVQAVNDVVAEYLRGLRKDG